MAPQSGLVALLSGLLLAACASTGAGKPGADPYLANAGDEINAFRFSTLYSWSRVDDDHVVVWTHPNEAYLLGLRSSCLSLGTEDAIVVDGFSGQVRVGLDSVVAGGERCRIDSIRPINLKAVSTQVGAG